MTPQRGCVQATALLGLTSTPTSTHWGIVVFNQLYTAGFKEAFPSSDYTYRDLPNPWDIAAPLLITQSQFSRAHQLVWDAIKAKIRKSGDDIDSVNGQYLIATRTEDRDGTTRIYLLASRT
jgi:hypothetical protein